MMFDERAIKLSVKDRRVLKTMAERLRAYYPQQVEQFILFGSRARGDASRESDFDLMVITRNGGKRLEKQVDKLLYQVADENNLVITPFVIPKSQIEKRAHEPFLRSVMSEGIDFYPPTPRRLGREKALVHRTARRGYKMKKEDRAQIQLRLERAEDYLAEARKLLESKMYPGAVSRAYYAVFTLTTAVLLTMDLVRAKHSGVESAFNYYFIRTKRLEEKYKDIFTRARAEREKSDYELKDYSDDEAQAIVSDCERFVARMRSYLKEVGAIAN